MPRRTESKKKRGGGKAVKIRFTLLLEGYLDFLILTKCNWYLCAVSCAV